MEIPEEQRSGRWFIFGAGGVSGSRGHRRGFNRPWTNGNGGVQSRGDALPFYSSEAIPISIKSVGFPPRRPIPLPRIDSGLSSDAKYGGFER